MKTKILITIDSEFSSHKDDIGVMGFLNNKYAGLPLFMEIGKKYNVRFTFFVDVYCVKDKYKSPFIKVCKELLAEGHDLQLHSHPECLFDSNRRRLFMYSLDEQIRIIKRGKEIFEDWFGFSPVAHRAGDWGADKNTLEALIANGFKIDSSGFLQYKHCRLSRGCCLSKQSSIMEIPPSVYRIQGLFLFNGLKLFSTDGNPMGEILDVFNRVIQLEPGVVNFVYHSFSFLRWNSNRTRYAYSEFRKKKFERLIEYIKARDSLEFALIKDIQPQDMNREGPVLSAGAKYFIPRLLDRYMTKLTQEESRSEGH